MFIYKISMELLRKSIFFNSHVFILFPFLLYSYVYPRAKPVHVVAVSQMTTLNI